MKVNFGFIKIALLVLLLGAGTSVNAQDKVEELEQRRQEIKAEINKINSLRSSNKAEEKSIITEVEDLDQRIRTTEKLIKVTNQQANLLTRDINTNTEKIKNLEEELEILKDDYAQMIEKSYKSKSQQSRIMFLLSSDNFLQAYKRLQYMKQYANHRKKQGDEIQERTVELQELIKSLTAQKKSKEKLIVENRQTQKELEQDKKEQQALVAQIREKEGEYVSQLKKKQKEINKIDKEIDRLIKEAIARNNKENGASTSNTFALTPEAKALAADFVSNKGRLPWPVKTGVVSMGFGEQKSSIVSSIPINSNGVRIETDKNAKAYAVFDGVVSVVQVIPGAYGAVIIKHGDYLTVYNGLRKIMVKRGDKVARGQELGEIATRKSTGKTVLYFQINKNMQKLNPEEWIYKM